MQLILLSGGSGKRLWPLSNEARSKQFLPLLERETFGAEQGADSTLESMVQRVVRQIREAGLTNNITLATNTSQQDITINQLGNSVQVVTEPERRGTFPAISLAACYLKQQQCSDDEVVVVMPCDPYTGIEYFHTIDQMVKCVEANVADLILMGIKPTYPSAKYGYVVPQTSVLDGSGFRFQSVSKFIEKPSVDRAEELLTQGAYWNGGVFAFRLGYMLEIVQQYISDILDFATVRLRFNELPKIAFDCEVVEKAQSLAMVPFDGEWKDLGTWITLTDELSRHAIGNVHLGPRCENVHVINELQHPIFADGLKDVVISACPDGILVCAKKETENIKKYVSTLTTRPMYEERRWGTYRVLDDTQYTDGSHSLTKSITLLPGKNISYQIHHHRSEVWTFVEGEGIFVMDGKEKHVKAGDTVIIPVEHFHAIKALTQLTFIEVQNGNPLIEEDIERFEWTWSKNS